MTVLSRALRRLDREAVPAVAGPPAQAEMLCVPSGAAWAPVDTLQAVAPIAVELIGQVAEPLVFPIDSSATPAEQGPLAAAAPASRDPSPQESPFETPRPQGEVLLAVDLSASHEQGRAVAAGLALRGRGNLVDDVAMVSIASGEPTPDLTDAFTEANEPGLYACRFHVEQSLGDRRRLLVMLDQCRQRFTKTVLVIDGDDAPALAVAASRVDATVLIGAAHLTPTSRLLHAENLVRSHAPSTRPRVVLAA